jgi:hypothetical protein
MVPIRLAYAVGQKIFVYLDVCHKPTPPTLGGLAGLSIEPSSDMALSPLVAYTTSNSTALIVLQPPARRQLLSRNFPPHEIISLIEAIFTSEVEIEVVCDLRGDGAQKLIDTWSSVPVVFLPLVRPLLLFQTGMLNNSSPRSRPTSQV